MTVYELINNKEAVSGKNKKVGSGKIDLMLDGECIETVFKKYVHQELQKVRMANAKEL